MSDVDTYNPYAPPVAQVDSGVVESGLKRRGLAAMVLLLIVTFGVYYVVWFFRRRPGLNRLNSGRKLPLWPLVAFAAYFALVVVLVLMAGDGTPEQVWGPGVGLLLSLVRLAVGILMLVQCFAIKDIIEDHAQAPDDAEERGLFTPRVQLSGIMTFFFSILYLQHAINKYVVDARR
jgi:hypothetical protein